MDMEQKLDKVLELTTRIDERVTHLRNELGGHIADDKAKHGEIFKRIGDVEKSQHRMKGYALGLAAAVSMASTWALKLWNGS